MQNAWITNVPHFVSQINTLYVISTAFLLQTPVFLFMTKGQQRCSSGTVAHWLPEDTVQLPGKQQGTTVEEIARLLKRIDRMWL